MAKENKSKYALLGMLSLGPMSGYDLKKLIEFSTANFWNESYAQIYPMLKQLAEEGLATSHTEKQEGKPERRIYTLTGNGLEELRSWLSEPVEYQVERNELLLKLFFGGHVLTPTNIEHIQQYRALQLQLQQKYEATEAYIKGYLAGSNHFPYWLITLNYGKKIAQALLAWCDETLDVLKSLPSPE